MHIKPLDHYRLSLEADKDLDSIFEYTTKEFGSDQAVTYLLEIEDLLESLLANPHLGKSREEIKEGLYSFPKGRHIIFYRIMNNHLRIVRVLHESRDIPNRFK